MSGSSSSAGSADSPVGPQRKRFIRVLESLWAEHSWAVIGCLWALVFVLGCIGFAQVKSPSCEPRSWSDIVYLVLQLIVLESGMVEGSKSLALEVARFAAPVLAATTAVKAFTSVFKEKIDTFVVRRLYRDHFVVCGLGRKARLLVDGLRRTGERVVVIERDKDNELLQWRRGDRTKVVLGDATDPEQLRRAALHRAKRLICVCGDDDANAEIVLAAESMERSADSGPLLCLAHVYSPHLCSLLRSRPPGNGSTSPTRVEFFSIFQVGAWALLNKHPPFGPPQDYCDTPPHVLIVGMGWLGQALLVQLARSRRRCRGSGTGAKARITVVDKEAERLTGYMESRFPGLPELCSLHPLDIDVQSREFQKADFLAGVNGAGAVSAAYICLANQSPAVEAALTIQERWRSESGFIAVRRENRTGVGKLFEHRSRSDSIAVPIYPFSLLDEAWALALPFRADRVRRTGWFHRGVIEEMYNREASSLERLARLLHEDYLAYQRGLGAGPAENQAAVEWEDLPKDFRRSNLEQTKNLAGRSLDSIGCYVLPSTDLEVNPFTFSVEEIETLAKEEHERWLRERREKGWTWGAVRNDERRHNPNIREWADLDQDADGRKLKDYNRAVVKRIPQLLAEVDYEIRRF